MTPGRASATALRVRTPEVARGDKLGVGRELVDVEVIERQGTKKKRGLPEGAPRFVWRRRMASGPRSAAGQIEGGPKKKKHE